MPNPAAVPPIVLLADADTQRVERHTTFLESSGLWVAVQQEPGVVLDDVLDLRPDAVVAAAQFHGQPLGRDLVSVLKSRSDTRDIPVVLLDNYAAPVRVADQADLYLEAKVAPDLLLQSLWTVLHSQDLRERAEDVRRRAGGLVERSCQLIARSHDIHARVDQLRRACPRCARALEWIECGRIDGEEFDYYHWCSNGCGLYCYNRAMSSWVKLAG